MTEEKTNEKKQKPAFNHWSLPVNESNVQATALSIIERAVDFRGVNSRPPPTLNDTYKKIKSSFPTTISEAQIRRKLLAILRKEHTDEDEFDKSLFQAFKECLGKNATAAVGDDSFIVSEFTKLGKSYGIGLSRQVDKAQLGIPENWGGTRNNRHDHSVVLFEKHDHGWVIKECTACVELKMNDTSCALVKDMERVSMPHFEDQAGALGQALMYTLVDVWTCLCRMGMLPDAGEGTHICLPVTVLAGKRAGKTMTTKCRWVTAELRIPERCGSNFGYAVHDFAAFSEAEREIATVEAYLQQLVFGFQYLVRYGQMSESAWSHPLPMSGRTLWPKGLGDLENKLKLVASTLPKAPFGSPVIPSQSASFTSENLLTPSQGELWCGSLKVGEWSKMLQDRQRAKFLPFFWPRLFETGIIVKVSSRAVHPQLLPPTSFDRAMSELRESGLLKPISDVLLAYYVRGGCLTTVMVDLRKQDYRPLFPKKIEGRLVDLWTGFENLVHKVLLPFAMQDIIHFDIRPGYDETSNILVKESKKRSLFTHHFAAQYEMRVIDLDGLVRFEDLRPSVPDLRYIPVEDHDDSIRGIDDAFSFLWWQLFLVGYTWALKIESNDLNVHHIIDEVRDGRRISCGEGEIRELLQQISKFFSKHVDSRGNSASMEAIHTFRGFIRPMEQKV